MHTEQSTTIQRPVDQVFQFLANPENFPIWAASVLKAEVAGTSLGVGTQFNQEVKVLGRQAMIPSEIIAYEPPYLFGWRSTGGPAPATMHFTTESSDSGTKVTMVQDVETGNLFKLAGPLMANFARRQNEADLTTLKDLLESTEV